jgi:hypothetical protein
MESFSVDCATNTQNTGQPRCGDNMGYDEFVMAVPNGTEFATEAAAKVLDNWTTIINAAPSDRGYPLPKFFKSEPAKNEDIFEEGIGGQSAFVAKKAGKGAYETLWISKCFAKKLQSFNDKAWSVFFFTNTGKIKAVTDSATKLKVQAQKALIRVGSDIMPTDTTAGKVPITIQLLNPTLWDTNGIVIDPSATFDPATDLLGIQDVYLTGATPTATGWVITIKTTCDNATVSGLVTADFVMLAGTTPVTIATVTETSDGVYTFVFPTQSGTVSMGLLNQPAMTTKGYEDNGTAITGTIA